MNTTIDIYLGAPITIESERSFLARLCCDLRESGRGGVILANFLLPPNRPIHQVDFLVVAPPSVCHVELKHFTKPIVGSANGPWSLREPNGSLTELDAKNPFSQALDCKYAISDAMKVFAGATDRLRPPPGQKFYSFFDSVVCVFPVLAPGSRVPQQMKWVQVLGYPAFLDRLKSRELNPGWSLDDWIEFARSLGLVRQRRDDEVVAPDIEAALRAIQQYKARFKEFYSADLHALVPTTVLCDGNATESGALRQILSEGSHGQFVGASGCGKTHLAKHLAIEAIDAGRLPIFASARLYDGKLSSLLDRSVAHLHPDTAIHFLTLAQKVGSPVTLILDGFNECREQLRHMILQDLQAFLLRWSIPVLLTTQTELSLPSYLSGPKFVFSELTSSERRELVGEYLAGSFLPVDAIEKVFAACRTAYDVSLAASCLEERSARSSRTSLYDAYVRRCCGQSRDPAVVRRALRELADVMHERTSLTVPISEAWRITERVIQEERALIAVMQDVLGCRLIEITQGEVAFRHELLQRFLAADSFVLRHANSCDLANELPKPRNRDLAEFILGLQTVASDTRGGLRALADAPTLRASFEGELGSIAQDVTKEDAIAIIQKARFDLDKMTFEIHQAPNTNAELRVFGVQEPSSYEKALLSALGMLARSAFCLDESLRLIADTWNTCIERLDNRYGQNVAQNPEVQSVAFSELFVWGRAELPASLISIACQPCFQAARNPDATPKLVALCETASTRTAPELYLILQILRNSPQYVSRFVPALLKMGLESGIYHVQLEALEFARCSTQSVDAAIKEEVLTLLHSFATENPFLSTAWIETLLAYDQVESPVSVDGASVELKEILASPDNPTTWDRAYSAVTRVFEDVFQGSYDEAIENLTPDNRVRLFTMAALGADSTCSIFADWILKELIKANSTIAIPAFIRWTNGLAAGTPFRQHATASFLFAHIGAAQHMDEPPQLDSISNDDFRAWQLLGEIVFWSHKSELNGTERRERCLPLWHKLVTQMPFEAVDPLFHVWHSGAGIPDQLDPVGKLFADFREQIRELLELGLKNREQLSSIYENAVWPYYKTERTRFIVEVLGIAGNARTISLLEPLVDTNDLGVHALNAIRQLKGRT